jgi:hypothetical protein
MNNSPALRPAAQSETALELYENGLYRRNLELRDRVNRLLPVAALIYTQSPNTQFAVNAALELEAALNEALFGQHSRPTQT